jgi:hypothetical protein
MKKASLSSEAGIKKPGTETGLLTVKQSVTPLYPLIHLLSMYWDLLDARLPIYL